MALEGRDDEALTALVQLNHHRSDSSPYYLSGPDGLLPLLATLAGSAEEDEVTQLLQSQRGSLRWNRQFLYLAKAVHVGRRGDRHAADQYATQAAHAAAMFPVARHLGARLVALSAAEDGWGEPVAAVRTAEAWFHEQNVTAAARTCRDVLRRLGASVQQRREGTEVVPPPLRAVGITAREYEVAVLVRQHLGNKAIADRLHISPRTVEKHMSALLIKLGVPDRTAVIHLITEASQR